MASDNLKNALQSTKKEEVKEYKGPKATMQALIKTMEAEIATALPSMISSERFQRLALTAFSNNKALQECDPKSFLSAMMQSAQLGLEPNTPLGQAYLIPYNSKQGKQVQFQLGYKGLLELAQRSGKIKAIYAREVYENDEFEIDYGLRQDVRHKPKLRGDRGNVIGYYAVYHTTDDGYNFEYMSKDEVIAHAQLKSKTYKVGPWQTDFNAMAKKTVIKQLLKYAPISIETQRALASDTTVKTKLSDEMADLADEAEYIDVEAKEIDEETGEVTEEQSAMQEATATIDRSVRSQLGFR